MKLRSYLWQKNLSDLYVLYLVSYLKNRQEKNDHENRESRSHISYQDLQSELITKFPMAYYELQCIYAQLQNL